MICDFFILIGSFVQRLRDNRLAMPERCCLTNRPTDDRGIAEIKRTVSQSESIEPLGAGASLSA